MYYILILLVVVDLKKMDKQANVIGANSKTILATDKEFMTNMLIRLDKL